MARMRTSSSPGPGRGAGTSRNASTSGPPNRSKQSALMDGGDLRRAAPSPRHAGKGEEGVARAILDGPRGRLGAGARDAGRLAHRLEVPVDEVLEGCLRHGAHHAVGHLAVLEQDEGGDAL